MKTEHIRLEQAAELLGIDVDTLLIAATESRLVKVWALVSAWRRAKTGRFEDEDHGGVWVPTSDARLRFFSFAPVFPEAVGDLLKRGHADLSCGFLSWPTEIVLGASSDAIWRDDECTEEPQPPLIVKRGDLFMRRDDLSFTRRVWGFSNSAEHEHVPAKLEVERDALPSGPTITRLMRAVKSFPVQYPAYRTKPPKLDADVRPWLRDVGLAENDAERRVFGAILREHFQLSPDNQKTQ